MTGWVVRYYIPFTPATDYLFNRHQAIVFATEALARAFAARPTVPDRIEQIVVEERTDIPADAEVWDHLPSPIEFLC